jgi:regulator of protease activity HflC (stomatin/prohibitin superfamily)
MSDAEGNAPGDEPRDEDAPRRGASAHFEVAAPVAAEVAMRQAMDPANQSLGEALKLSYRLLQVAIVGLIVTFLFSGFQTVQEGMSGIRTIFGRISGEPGQEALSPGLNPFWPYPVGDITVFETRRVVELRAEFWPRRPSKDTTIEQMIDGADPTAPLKPGIDGSVITGDGDLAHLQVVAEYVIEDPVRFLETVDLEKGDAIVRIALSSGVTSAVARMPLQELVDQREQPAVLVQAEAQRILDGMGSGIRLQKVALPERSAPFVVRNALRRVQTGKEDAKTVVDKARQEATAKLLAAAGPNYDQILSLIDGYEQVLSSGDLARADQLLHEIGQRLEMKDIGGTASSIINRAKSYQSAITANLGKDVRRIDGLRDTWNQNPQQLVRQLWLDGLRTVLTQSEVEVFSMPPGVGQSQISIASSPEVMQARRNADMARRKRAAAALEALRPSWELGVKQTVLDKAGRRLDQNATQGFGRENK